MPNLGPTELLIIGVVLVLLFGATRLPQTAKGLGQALKIFKKEVRDDDKPAEVQAAPVQQAPVQQEAPVQQAQASSQAAPAQQSAPAASDGSGSASQPVQDTDSTRR